MPRILPLLILAALMLPGCGLWQSGPDKKLAAELSALRYPADATQGEDLDVLVIVKGDSLKLVNRTPRAYDDMQLWLNQQYVGQVKHLAIGTDNKLNLNHFVNFRGEGYPTGSFLHPEDKFPVVMAELYDPATNTRHRLLARVTGL